MLGSWTFSPAELAATPPRWTHPKKRVVAEAVGDPVPSAVTVTRWAERPLPSQRTGATIAAVELGVFAYPRGSWTLNFANAELFCAYGDAAFAQDEIQVAEHPLLGAVRERMIADGVSTMTVERGRSTPILVEGAPRQADIDALWIYGRQLARAADATIRQSVRRIPATPSNIVAIEAPSGGSGPYVRADLERALATAFSGFAAARDRGATEVHTGFWGCGAYGGDRTAMVAVQLEAARLAGLQRLIFRVPLRAQAEEAATGIAWSSRAAGVSGWLDDAANAGWSWGTSDGS